MQCPYCQREMALGYIQCRDGVTWTPKKQPIAALSALGRDSTPLSNVADHSKIVCAHKCASCKKVVIEFT